MIPYILKSLSLHHRMLKGCKTYGLLLVLMVAVGCSTQKNTPATRSFHQTKVKYNIMFNGNNTYNEGLEAINKANKDDYTKVLNLYPISNPSAAQAAASQMEVTIEKCRKCIKLHSIKAKPKPDPKKRNDPEYKRWLESEEFNNQMGKAWLRLGQAEFHKGDFLGSVGTFTYILNHYKNDPDMQACCQLWIARAYGEMGWLYEAEEMIQKVKVDDLSREHAPIYSAHMADFLLKTKQYHAAIPYVKIALPEEKRKLYRPRFEYVLAQLYELEGNKAAAKDAYQKVIRLTPPVEMDVNAHIRRAQLDGLAGVKSLLRMTKQEKNKDRLDVLYGAIGHIYLSAKDTTKALEYFDLGIEKSTQGGYDKASVLLVAGDLYFDRRDYVKAQPCYNEAATILSVTDEAYARVSKRAEVLDELVKEYTTYQLQDSLQRLSKLTEEEQMKVCEQLVAQLIDEEKKAEEAAALAAREAQLSGVQGINTMNMLGGGGDAGKWYFYNDNLLRSGKQMFAKKWNNRKLEDNWRRASKSGSTMMEMEDMTMASGDTTATDSTSTDTTATAKSAGANDPHNPLYYFQQIPRTPEDLQNSDSLLAQALAKMVDIYWVQLEDSALADETREELLRRYPGYTLTLTNRQHLSEAEVTEWLAQQRLQDSLYESTYEAFKKGQFKQVKTNTSYAQSTYPESKLIPRFLFLNAVAVARQDGQEPFKQALEEMIALYPENELSAKAKDMLAMLGQGMQTKKGGALSNLEGKREQQQQKVDEPTQQQVQLSKEVKGPAYVLILMPTVEETVLNDLLYETALFNFSQFLIRDFDIQVLPVYGEGSAMRIEGLDGLKEALWYIDLMKKNEELMRVLTIQSARLIPITQENYPLFQTQCTEDEYKVFLKKIAKNLVN